MPEPGKEGPPTPSDLDIEGIRQEAKDVAMRFKRNELENAYALRVVASRVSQRIIEQAKQALERDEKRRAALEELAITAKNVWDEAHTLGGTRFEALIIAGKTMLKFKAALDALTPAPEEKEESK